MYELSQNTILHGRAYKYKIVKRLGQGGFGITYLATVQMVGELGSIDTEVKVAVKEFFMRDINGRGRDGSTVTCGSKGGVYDNYKKKFSREALSLSRLQHPNIIKVIESFEANNTVYFVMEFLDGGSLRDYIEKKGRLTTKEAISISKQIGEALSFMHGKRMLHLDLKPGNVMMREENHPVLIDFGLSKQYDSNGNPESSTTVGGGTPGFAPVEQLLYRDARDFPIGMDVYAFGATLFNMLTGKCPPDSSVILNDGFPLDDLTECGVGDGLTACIVKAMAPVVKARYKTVKDFVAAIAQYENEVGKKTVANDFVRGKGQRKEENWKSQGANLEDAAACFDYGQKYYYGYGVPKDYAKAFAWFRKGAEQGNADAQFTLGLMYDFGQGVAQSFTDAAKWYTMAAEHGNVGAQFSLGAMYECGQGVPQSFVESEKWYRKAAEQGNAGAQSNLALKYFNGQGVSLDYVEAAKWFHKAAEQGNLKAQSYLGKMFLDGRGVAQNHAEALKWFRKAAERGDTASQCHLGKMYEKGMGVAQNYNEAVKWYRKAAEQRDVYGQYALGTMYRDGHGVPKDYVESVRWFRMAAEQEYADAQNALGLRYEYGQGVPQNFEEAMKWYRKAAEKGNAKGQVNLGWMFGNGRGVPKNDSEAVKWYRMAAEQGNAFAQYNLGLMYENGRGLQRDLSSARFWYEKAAAKGYEEARKRLNALKGK